MTLVLSPELPLEQVVWVSPDRLSGAPCFAHTRVPVKALFDYLEGGASINEFLRDFEGVAREQAVAALYYGKAQLIPPGTPQPTGLRTAQ
jgi:uncharacterized protein (DUF433 family)